MSLIAVEAQSGPASPNRIEVADFFSSSLTQADNFFTFVNKKVAEIVAREPLEKSFTVDDFMLQPWVLRGKKIVDQDAEHAPVVDLEDPYNAYLLAMFGIHSSTEIPANMGLAHATAARAVLKWGFDSSADGLDQLTEDERNRFPNIFKNRGVALRYRPESLTMASGAMLTFARTERRRRPACTK